MEAAMKVCYEKVIASQPPIVSDVIRDGGGGWLHVHPEYEISLVESGNGTRCIGNCIENYSPGELILIAGMIPHSYCASSCSAAEELKIRNIKFLPDFAGKDFFQQPLFSSIAKLLDDATEGVIFSVGNSRELLNCFDHFLTGDSVKKVLSLLEILDILCRLPRRKLALSIAIFPEGDERILRILRYIHDNISTPEKLTLERMARVACLSPGAFCSFFSQKFNRRYLDYVNELRICMVCNRLSDSRVTITQIAYEVGFTNLSNFNRMFLRYKGCSPSQYRKKLREFHSLCPGL